MKKKKCFLFPIKLKFVSGACTKFRILCIFKGKTKFTSCGATKHMKHMNHMKIYLVYRCQAVKYLLVCVYILYFKFVRFKFFFQKSFYIIYFLQIIYQFDASERKLNGATQNQKERCKSVNGKCLICSHTCGKFSGGAT